MKAIQRMKELIHDTRAQGKIFGKIGIDDIVEACVALIIVGVLVPVAVTMFTGADIESMKEAFPKMGDQIGTLWGLLPFLVLLAIIIGVVYGALAYIEK
jgi:phage-related protein